MEYHTLKMFDECSYQAVTNGFQLALCMQTDSTDFDIDEMLKQNEEHDLTISDVKTCSFCDTNFDTLTQQREHYKLDWHRYNLKQTLAGLPPIKECDFDQHIDNVSSISGSEDESEDEVDLKSLKINESTKLTDPKIASINRHTKVFFENADGKIFSVYRCLLYNKKNVPETDVDLVNCFTNLKTPCYWTIIMLGGGHFAAAVFKNGEAIQHKTHHSYTVRAKQGGTQNAKDNRSNNNAKSAGASIRRYNEQAQLQHIQEILTQWSEHVKNCDLILYRAVGPQNRTVLFGGKTPALNKHDVRLRTIPFATRRATFKEIQRVYEILSSVEVYGSASTFKEIFPTTPNKKEKSVIEPSENPDVDVKPTKKTRKPRNSQRSVVIDRAKSRELIERELPGADIRAAFIRSTSNSSDDRQICHQSEITVNFSEFNDFNDDMDHKSNQVDTDKTFEKDKRKRKNKTKVKRKTVDGEMSKEERARKVCFDKIVKICGFDDAELLEKTLVDVKNEMSDVELKLVLNMTIDDAGNTLLHFCAGKLQHTLLRPLMVHGSDPSKKNKQNQPPYSATDNKEVRLAFRVFLNDFPDLYDYSKSHIPGPYNEDEEREKEEKRKLLKKMKRKKELVKKKEKLNEKYEEDERKRFATLSDREKRALAAERRILSQNKKVVLARCFLCGLDITGKVPFSYHDFNFCTITCLQAHKVRNSKISSNS